MKCFGVKFLYILLGWTDGRKEGKKKKKKEKEPSSST